MQNQITHTFKTISIAFAAVVFVALTTSLLPVTAKAADLPGGSYYDYSYPTPTAPTPSAPSNSGGSYYDYSYPNPTHTPYTYTPPTYNNTPPSHTTPTPTPTCVISVNDTSITAGQSVIVTWSSSNATIGSISNLGANLPAAGSHAVTLSQTTTFSGSFLGNGKTATCSKTVTVTPKPAPAPTCALTVNDTSITRGQAVTVSWSSTNASSRSITNIGSGLAASGSTIVYPTQTTVYTGTFTGNGKTVTCTKTVTVAAPTPAPTCALNVSQSAVTSGQAVTVTWSSTNATSRSISNIGSGLAASGSSTFYPSANTTFVGTFSGANGSVTCSKTVTVTTVTPAPTCNITASPSNLTPGQPAVITWTSTNASNRSISNIGSGLAASGSTTVYPNQTTTYTGTFSGANGSVTCSQTIVVTSVQYCPAGYTGTYPDCVPPVQYCPAGYTGTYPNCYPPQQNNPSCTITINNYNNTNGYYTPNQAVTISWSSINAQYGSINNNFGSVALSGSRTIYPNQTTTYTGTFYGYNGQSVTCSATVYMSGYVPPVNPTTPYVTLAAVPYTGLELGPVGTVLYWSFLAFWCLLAAYLIVVKRLQDKVYASLKGFLFGTADAQSDVQTQVFHTAGHVSYTAPVATHEDAVDSFVMQQINRARA